MKPKILFLGCNYNEIPYLENLQERGFYVVATDVNPDAPGMKMANSAVICGYNDYDGLESAIMTEGPDEFYSVFTASAQFAHLGASYISKKLGITYPAIDNIRACLNKKSFYPLFQENGIAIPETRYIKNFTDLKRALSDYSDETDFYLKSDYSKNPNHIYTGKSSSLIKQDIQWTTDRYFQEYYILQKTYEGYGVRLNLFPNGYELYDFETAKPIRIEDCPKIEEYKILELLGKLSEKLGMQNWLLKFDVLLGKEGYVVLDIGMDPPSRMKKNWEENGRNFVDFYLDLYIGT